MKVRRVSDMIGVVSVAACAVMAILPLLWLLAAALAGGWQAVMPTASATFRSWTGPSEGSLLEACLRTLRYLMQSAVISLPIAFGIGLYLEVLAAPGRLRTLGNRVVRIGAAIPPLSWGVGLALILRATGALDAEWALICSFSIVILPTALQYSCDAFAAIERGQVPAAHALGATRRQIACTINLSLAWRNLLAGYLRVLARSSGEAVPFVALFLYAPETHPISLLPFRLLSVSGSPFTALHAEAWAGVLVLLAFSAALHLIALILKGAPTGD